MNIRTLTAFAAGAVVALVLGTGTAYAANGGHFVLGRSQLPPSRAASLNNSNGTALILRSKAGEPSLIVNRTTKVPNSHPADMSRTARTSPTGSPWPTWSADRELGDLSSPASSRPAPVDRDGIADNWPCAPADPSTTRSWRWRRTAPRRRPGDRPS